MIRLFAAAAAGLLIAAGAQAQERWATGFRQGFSFATLNASRGQMLQLSCDTSGRKPGRGAIIAELRAPKGSVAAPAQPVELLAIAAGQTIRLKASVSVAPARDAVPGSARRRNGETLVDTRASATEDAVTLSYDLDGSAEAAAPFVALAAALAREPREASLRVPALNLETKLPSRQAARALRGFDKGCQDALPSADDEMQWDWQQGLDRIDDKPQITLAAAADESDGPKLMLRCASGTLQAMLTRWPAAGSEDRISVVIQHASGEKTQALWDARRSGGDRILEGEKAAQFIASIWRGERVSFTAASAELSFPIDGVPLATRKLIEACPTPLLPPKN